MKTQRKRNKYEQNKEDPREVKKVNKRIEKTEGKNKEKSYTRLALLVSPLSFDRGLDTRKQTPARIEGMTTPSNSSAHGLRSSDNRELPNLRALAKALFARIDELEADQLASDEAWLETSVEQATPREQMQRRQR